LKSRWIVLLVGLSLIIGGVAYAASEATGTTAKFMGMRGGKFDPRGAGGFNVVSEVAKTTGMTEADVIKERQAGKSLNQILTAKGKDATAIVNQAVQNFTAQFKKRMDDTTPMPAPGMWMGARGSFGFMGEITKATGMTMEEIMKERQAGKSFSQILTAKGKDAAAIIAKAVADHKAQLDKMVAAGKLTQDKANTALANFETMIKKMMEDTTVMPGPGPNSKGFWGKGMMTK